VIAIWFIVIGAIVVSEIQLPIDHKPSKKKKKANFYSSWPWRKLRYKVIKHYGGVCMICGASGKGVVISVDHIKPRSLYPELELDFDNMQVACMPCNMGKSNIDFTDWRSESKNTILKQDRKQAL
jgi:5-methylcytosine-specific restriction endonuclease McrA